MKKTILQYEKLIIITLLFLLSIIHFFVFKYIEFPKVGLERLYHLNETTNTYFIFSITLALLPAFFIKKELKNPSQLTTLLLYLLVYMPICLLSPLWYEGFNQNFFNFSIVFAGCFTFLTYVSNEKYHCRINFKEVSQFISLDKILIYINIFLFLYFFYLFGIPDSRILDLNNIYVIRLESRIIIDATYLNKYLFTSFFNFTLPFSAIYFFLNKKYIKFLLSIAVTFYLFSITGAKLALVFPIAYLILFCALKHFKKQFSLFVISLLITLIAILLIKDSFSQNNHYFISLIIGRAFYIHSSLAAAYIEYFGTIDNFRMLADSSVIRYIFSLQKPDLPIPFTIGSFYFSSPANFANENYLVTAYANFGHIGMMLFTIALAMYLKVYDFIAMNKNYYYSIFLILPFSFALVSAGLETALLSGGGILAILFLMFFLPKESRN